MTLEEIKAAVLAGKTVHWVNDGYRVTNPMRGQWLIVFTRTDNTIGLTWTDGVTMNGNPDEFYIKE